MKRREHSFHLFNGMGSRYLGMKHTKPYNIVRLILSNPYTLHVERYCAVTRPLLVMKIYMTNDIAATESAIASTSDERQL